MKNINPNEWKVKKQEAITSISLLLEEFKEANSYEDLNNISVFFSKCYLQINNDKNNRHSKYLSAIINYGKQINLSLFKKRNVGSMLNKQRQKNTKRSYRDYVEQIHELKEKMKWKEIVNYIPEKYNVPIVSISTMKNFYYEERKKWKK